MTVRELEAEVEARLHGLLVGWGFPMSTRQIRVWLEEHGVPAPIYTPWVTARLKALVKRGLVEQIVWPAVANQEGHYWQAIDG